MKYRDYKNLKRDNYYHIFNRGVNKQNIFNDPSDYYAFTTRMMIVLNKFKDKTTLNLRAFTNNEFSIIAYCLMPNHYHILIRQNSDIPISKFIGKLITSYSKYYNNKYERVGHLFQDTYKAKLVQNDEYMIQVSSYIHTNPQEESLSYPFSSLYEYMTKDMICDTKFILNYFNGSALSYINHVKRQIKRLPSKR